MSGYIGEVLVADNEQVKAGQVLARIDDRDYRAALDQGNADVEAAKAAAATKQALLTAQQSAIDAALATIAVDQANLMFAEQEDKRYSQLAATGYGSVQNAQQAASRIAAARAAIARDIAALESATRQLDVLKAELAPGRRRRSPVTKRWPGKPPSIFPTRHRVADRWRCRQPHACASANTCRRARS